jgi:thiamine biosynthesis lipoprotein
MSVAMPSRRSWVEHIMGLPISVHLRGWGGPARRQAAVDAVFAELRAVDRLFSPYRPDSDVSRLARGEITPAQSHPDVSAVLDLCADAEQRTDGYFTAHLPGPDGVARLDPTGLVKGWAAQRAARHLAELPHDDFYLNAGGDIALGQATEPAEELGRPWRIAVEDPFQPAQHLGVLALSAGGIATSGTAHRGAHIVDPHTGQAASGLASVTVVGPSLLWADVYATALFARGSAEVDDLAWLSGYQVIAVTTTGRVVSSQTVLTRLQR